MKLKLKNIAIKLAILTIIIFDIIMTYNIWVIILDIIFFVMSYALASLLYSFYQKNK